MNKIRFDAYTIFLLVTGGAIAFAISLEPEKTLTLLAWVLVVAVIFACLETAVGKMRSNSRASARK